MIGVQMDNGKMIHQILAIYVNILVLLVMDHHPLVSHVLLGIIWMVMIVYLVVQVENSKITLIMLVLHVKVLVLIVFIYLLIALLVLQEIIF